MSPHDPAARAARLVWVRIKQEQFDSARKADNSAAARGRPIRDADVWVIFQDATLSGRLRGSAVVGIAIRPLARLGYFTFGPAAEFEISVQ